MSKIVGPPQITELDGLLDLMLHPEKGMKYLQDLQGMRDQIVAHLGLVDSKEKIEAMQAQAEAKIQESIDSVAAAQDFEQETKKKCQDLLDAMTAKAKKHDQDMAQAQAALAQAQADLAKREKELADGLADVTAQRLSVMALSDSLAQKKKELDAREEKLNKLKMAMGEAGI